MNRAERSLVSFILFVALCVSGAGTASAGTIQGEMTYQTAVPPAPPACGFLIDYPGARPTATPATRNADTTTFRGDTSHANPCDPTNLNFLTNPVAVELDGSGVWTTTLKAPFSLNAMGMCTFNVTTDFVLTSIGGIHGPFWGSKPVAGTPFFCGSITLYITGDWI